MASDPFIIYYNFISSIPEQTLTTFLVIKSFKYTISGLALWGLYKLLVPRSLSTLARETFFNLWTSAVKSLSK